MLNVIVESLEEVPEGAREHYQERDGKFQLDLTGAYSSIDRDNLLTSLRKERTDHGAASSGLKAFGEHTPESIATLEGERDQLVIELDVLKTADGPTGADLDKLVESRVVSRLAPVQRELDRLKGDFDTVTGERDGLVDDRKKDTILRKVLGAFGKKELGANPDAMPDVELWAAGTFEIDASGEVVSRDGAGVTPGLKPTDVFKDMKDNKQRRHWFGATIGGGASGGTPNPDATGENPFAVNEATGQPRDMTAAARMVRDDPGRAKRLAIQGKAQRFFPSLFK